MTKLAINTNGATKATVEDIKPYMVSIEELESFDNDELLDQFDQVKDMISNDFESFADMVA